MNEKNYSPQEVQQERTIANERADRLIADFKNPLFQKAANAIEKLGAQLQDDEYKFDVIGETNGKIYSIKCSANVIRGEMKSIFEKAKKNLPFNFSHIPPELREELRSILNGLKEQK